MRRFLLQFTLLLALIFIFFLSFTSIMPVVKLSSQRSSTKFSTYRALQQVKEISRAPHYAGSENHSRVRNYIVNQLQDLGLWVHTQTGEVLNNANILTRAENIVTRIPGTAPRPNGDLLLLGHYDSEPHSSYGASDDGVAVAAILEALRALREKGMEPKNNIVIVLTDAEEIGLLGAQLFAEEHPLVKNIGLVLNFEARGTSGPSNTILETNYGNAKLIRAFAKARPRFPMASSLMYEVYKNMPNDTDATVFREELNIPGFFFAFIDGHYNYHTANDNYAHVDRNSLAHQGAYLMDLLPYFGNADLADFETDANQVYFNFPFFKFIHYNYSWIFPLVVLSWLLFIGILIGGYRKRKLERSGIIRGGFAFFISLVFAGLLGILGWKMVLRFYPQYEEIQQGFPYNGHYYIVAFALLLLAVILGLYNALCRQKKAADVLVVPTLIWLVINTALAIFFKGASYFIFPTLFLVLALASLLWKERFPKIILLLLVIPAIFIFAPLLVYVPVALGMKALFAGLVLMVLVYGLLLPVLTLFFRSRWPAYLFGLGGIVFLFMAHSRSSFSADRPRPDSLVYILNKETKTAIWKSYDKTLDNWTRQKIDATIERKPSPAIMPSKYGSGFLYEQKAPVWDIPGAAIQMHQKSSDSGYTAFQLKIFPKRRMDRMVLFSLDQEMEYKDLKFNGLPSKDSGMQHAAMYKSSQQDKKRLLTYYLVDQDTLRVDFSIPSGRFPKLELYGASYDLLENPWFQIKPREADKIPRPFTLNDAIITRQIIDLK